MSASGPVIQWREDPINIPVPIPFAEAKRRLLDGLPSAFISALVGNVEVDYKPIEKILGAFTKVVHAQFKPPAPQGIPREILVIPRGSFATRTAVKGHVDLDLDVIFPDNYEFEFTPGVKTTIKKALGTDEAEDNILFEKEKLKRVLLKFYDILVAYAPSPIDPEIQLNARQWITPLNSKPLDQTTRSLSLQTTQTGKIPSVPLDVFIKVRTTIRGRDVIIGLEKDSLVGNRSYQTTSFIPTEGKWIGDKMLNAVDRVALLTLKWWKNDLKADTTKIFQVQGKAVPKPKTGATTYNASKIEIKSHHLLAALNALHNLDVGDPLYVPEHSSQSFSLVRVKDVMIKILSYLDRAYRPELRDVRWYCDGRRLDYFIPQESWGPMERLFMQARANWDSYCYLVDSDVIASFRDEIQGATRSGMVRTFLGIAF